MLIQILNILIYPFLFLSLFAQIFILSTFFSGRKKILEEEEEKFQIKPYPRLSICVPCWNEEKTVSRTIDSIIASDYPKDKLEILIIDNNSKDQTLEVAKLLKEKYKNIFDIKVFKEEKQGKHHAINTGIKFSTADFFGCLDADSTLSPNAISQNMKYFSDPETMASTSCIKIEYPQKTLIQKLQAIEYLVGVFMRKTYGFIDAIYAAPGPLSIYRKEVFVMIGEFKDGHKVEDFEMTIRMHRNHLRIANSHQAFVYTLGPSTIKGYLKQRVRWLQGGLENIIDNRDMILKREYGHFGFFVMPTVVIFVFYALYILFALFYVFYLFFLDKISLWAVHNYIFTLNYIFNFKRFDLFYVNTSMILFLVMIMLSLAVFSIYIGKKISESHKDFYRNFIIYFFLYPYLAFYFLGKSCFNILLRKENTWEVQDNKLS